MNWKEVTFFAPKKFNDGSVVPPSVFQKFEKLLLTRFGGFTRIPCSGQCIEYRDNEEIVYEDENVMYKIITSDLKESDINIIEKFIKQGFKQNVALIYITDVESVRW